MIRVSSRPRAAARQRQLARFPRPVRRLLIAGGIKRVTDYAGVTLDPRR